MLGRNFELEVLYNGKSLKEYSHEGSIYVEGKPGSSYSIRVKNNTGTRVVANISVDGLSIVDGDEADYNRAGYVINAYDSLIVSGWRQSDEKVSEFYFSTPEDSYGEKVGKGHNLGVIGVAITREKAVERSASYNNTKHFPVWPNDNITFSTSSSSSSSSGTMNSNYMSSALSGMKAEVGQRVGTGWGADKVDHCSTVNFSRENSVSEVLSIYYNTRGALDKMGIIKACSKPKYVTPSSFPGGYCKPPKK